MVRPVKSFDAILNMELQRTQGAKVTLTLEISAEAPNGFSEADVGVVRANARQLRFKAGRPALVISERDPQRRQELSDGPETDV